MANTRGCAKTRTARKVPVRLPSAVVRALQTVWRAVVRRSAIRRLAIGAALLAIAAGCASGAVSSPESASPSVSTTPLVPATPVPSTSETVDVTIETDVKGVPEEVSKLADEAFALFDHPFPASWDAPETIVELEPLVADTVIVQDWIRTGAEPGSVMLESTQEGYWAEISANTFFVDLALNWHCAWLNGFVLATEAGKDIRVDAALDQLLKFPDLPHVREEFPAVDELHSKVVHPLVEGDLVPAKAQLEHCRDLTEG